MTREEVLALKDSFRVEWWMDEQILSERIRKESNRLFDIGLGENDIMNDQERLKELRALWEKMCDEEIMWKEEIAKRGIDASLERFIKQDKEFHRKWDAFVASTHQKKDDVE
jgi:hypothetical protein